MAQYTAEKRLAISYIICAVFGIISSVTSGIAWGHWKSTLDQCRIGTNCSCILYARHTPSKFLGGNIAPCAWVTFGPLFYVFFCVALTCFHGYRVLFSFQSSSTRTIMTKNRDGETVQMHAVQSDDTNPLPRLFWIIVSTFSVIFILYAFIHFLVFVIGFQKTCNEYRKRLELQLHGTGDSKIVMHQRLSCQSVLDFMDYLLHQDVYSRRDGIINTGLDLILGINASIFSTMFFVYASILNIKMSRIKY